MADTEYRRLIQAATDKAQLGFMAVVQRTIQDADKNVVEQLSTAKSGLDYSALSAVRHFLRQDGTLFLRHIDTAYRKHLERAMQTMYIDLRPDMRQLSASDLSLVDDEVINHQIEVGRLTQRMREANEEAIGRLNVMVANLHGEVEARERENPFRPYLLARALFEAVHETIKDEHKDTVLFEHLAAALIPHLASFYSSIREVFEASGVRGKFIAQRSRAAYHRRYYEGAPQGPAGGGAGTMGAVQLTPELNQVLVSLQQALTQGKDGADPARSLQNLVRSMFTPENGAALKPERGRAGAPQSASLIAQLTEYQEKAARGESVVTDLPLGSNQLTALRERFDLTQASVHERMTVEVVGMLFEIVLEDEQIPEQLRTHIALLQIPTLKTALLEPNLMQDEGHPARRLLNRMSSTAAGVDMSAAAGLNLALEMERVAHKILVELDRHSGVFAEGLHEFEHFLSGYLREDDKRVASAIEAVESAERYSVLLTNTTRALCDVLLPLNVDKRVSDFIITVWPHVLVQAAWQDVGDDGQRFAQYHAVLPELLWSVQQPANAQERADLMKLLPGLVRRLRAALGLIQLPEDESQPMLDLLVSLHGKILRSGARKSTRTTLNLATLRQEFARITVNWERATWGLSEAPPVRESVIDDAFVRSGARAALNLEVRAAASLADREFLTQTYLLGTRVELRGEGAPRITQLIWISTHRSLYLFRDQDDARLSVYSAAALLEALAAQSVVPLEYAPVFERAVESLLYGVKKIELPD